MNRSVTHYIILFHNLSGWENFGNENHYHHHRHRCHRRGRRLEKLVAKYGNRNEKFFAIVQCDKNWITCKLLPSSEVKTKEPLYNNTGCEHISHFPNTLTPILHWIRLKITIHAIEILYFMTICINHQLFNDFEMMDKSEKLEKNVSDFRRSEG